MKLSLIILAILFTSCSVLSPNKSGCGTERDVMRHDAKPFRVMKLKDGGTIAASMKPGRATLVSVKRTMKGFKHTFITSGSDTLIEYLPKQFYKVGECYMISFI